MEDLDLNEHVGVGDEVEAAGLVRPVTGVLPDSLLTAGHRHALPHRPHGLRPLHPRQSAGTSQVRVERGQSEKEIWSSFEEKYLSYRDSLLKASGWWNSLFCLRPRVGPEWRRRWEEEEPVREQETARRREETRRRFISPQ